jgi:CDP-diglyceride synthetase
MPPVSIGKYVVGKIGGVCFLVAGVGLISMGVSDDTIRAPIRAVTIGLALLAFGVVLLAVKRNGKFIWERDE